MPQNWLLGADSGGVKVKQFIRNDILSKVTKDRSYHHNDHLTMTTTDKTTTTTTLHK